MITSGDMQFEPPTGKIMFVSSAVGLMAAGDSAFHHEIMSGLLKSVGDRISGVPAKWINVKDVVDLYIKLRNEAKLKRAEASVLAPLGLDRDSFLRAQRVMDPDLVRTISTDLINFEVPNVSVIVAGLDDVSGDGSAATGSNAHIYSIHNEYISCDDVIGFRAIGSGSRHAESHFMLARHGWNADAHSALMLAYQAKKDAEVAPGVGSETDVWMIGPTIGQNSNVREEIVEHLDQQYHKLKEGQLKLRQEAAAEIKRYVDSLPPVPTAQADKPPSAETATVGGGGSTGSHTTKSNGEIKNADKSAD